MIIKDEQGKYQIKLDVTKGIATQSHSPGLMAVDAMERLHNDYMKKVVPAFRGKKWAKLCDLRGYCASPAINIKMEEHNKFCIENGMADVALIVESAVAKMQMNLAGKKVSFAPQACLSESEAMGYLKEKGYR